MRRVPSSWKLIDAVLREHVPQAFRALRPPATASAVAELERTLRVMLPPAVAASYRIHNGMRDTPETLNNFHRLLSLREVVRYWYLCRRYPWDESVREPRYGHGRRIKTDQRWRVKWVPLMVTAGGDLLCLDLDPGPNGRRGQVYQWHNYPGPPLRVMADSFREWLDRLATELETGRFAYTDKDGLQLDLRLG